MLILQSYEFFQAYYFHCLDRTESIMHLTNEEVEGHSVRVASINFPGYQPKTANRRVKSSGFSPSCNG